MGNKQIHPQVASNPKPAITCKAPSNNHCPSCCNSIETVEHFLQCSHPNQQAIWCNLHNPVYKLHPQQNVPSQQYYNVLAYMLYKRCKATLLQLDKNVKSLKPYHYGQLKQDWDGNNFTMRDWQPHRPKY